MINFCNLLDGFLIRPESILVPEPQNAPSLMIHWISLTAFHPTLVAYSDIRLNTSCRA